MKSKVLTQSGQQLRSLAGESLGRYGVGSIVIRAGGSSLGLVVSVESEDGFHFHDVLCVDLETPLRP